MPKAHRLPRGGVEVEAVTEPAPVAAVPQAPSTSAGIAAWRAYAVELGVDSRGTKKEIQARLS